MKLEFFQRKFWTASRQVSSSGHGSLGGPALILHRCPHSGPRAEWCQVSHGCLSDELPAAQITVHFTAEQRLSACMMPRAGNRDFAPTDSSNRDRDLLEDTYFLSIAGTLWIFSVSLLILSHLDVYL